MRAAVARLSPGDLPGYERFMAASEAIYRVALRTARRRAVHPLDQHGPRGARPGGFAKLAQRARPGRPHVRDERLRTVLSFHPLLVGGDPFSASSVYALIAFLERRWGVHFAMGGTGAPGTRPGRAGAGGKAARSAAATVGGSP